jgi:5-methylcytosine-specific restriction endonuclease McrA
MWADVRFSHLDYRDTRSRSKSSHASAARGIEDKAHLRNRLAEAQNWRCCHCQRRMDGYAEDWDAPTIEHVVSLVDGGADDWSNMACACRRCNLERGITHPRFIAIYDRQPTTGLAKLGDILGPALEGSQWAV